MDPRKIPTQELERMRAEVARTNGIDQWKAYTEKQAAAFLKVDISTVKRNRRAGRLVCVTYMNGSIRYNGVMVCDIILFGEKAALLWGGAEVKERSLAAAE